MLICDCTQTPAKHAGAVQGLPSVSGPHGELSSTWGWSHEPVTGLHGRSWRHWLPAGAQTVVWWVWTHWPCSQPAWVQAFESLSVHGVLSGFGGCWQRPVAGLQPRSSVHSLLSGGQGV